ncbi:gliding-motility protein MglA, partial [candidate division WOR-3 bacterium]|nr:gliding-motility protein MglA [candidate division WOR-3 bacterium]
PGQVYYNSTRKLVLQGADGIVFVADSQEWRMEDNIHSFKNLEKNLRDNGYDIKSVPLVIQYNKRDLQDVTKIEDIRKGLNSMNVPDIPTSALKGEGIIDTFRLVGNEVLKDLRKKFNK